jgi:hypothetical protein
MWRSAVAVLLTTVLAAEVRAACPDDVQVAAFVADYRDLQVSKGFGAGLSVQDGMFLPFQPPSPGRPRRFATFTGSVQVRGGQCDALGIR